MDLHITVHELTMSFPKFEMYELGSQLRRSSNSVPANLAEVGTIGISTLISKASIGRWVN